jgi:phosphatidylserine/phosphatidylglycerophosphate/cardiolipin synthase-like enzyme
MRAFFSNIQNHLLDELDHATATIEIAVSWFTNVALMNCLLDKLTKGVKVTLVINNDEINNNDTNKSYLISLLEKGGVIHWINYPDLMHQKFCIIDSRIVANGSYNWTYYAERNNRENIVFLDNHEIVAAFKKEYERLTILYPAQNSIPPVGKSSIENNIFKRIKESETQNAQKHQKDIPDYCITTNWHNQSSINMRLTSKNDFITIVRRKPKSIERVFDAELENNDYSCLSSASSKKVEIRLQKRAQGFPYVTEI